MKRRIYKLSKIVNSPTFVAWMKVCSTLIITAFFTSLFFYIKAHKIPNIGISKSNDYLYEAKNGTYKASFGEKGTNLAKVNFAVGDYQITFSPASGQTIDHKVTKEKNSLKFEEIYKGIDFVYHPVINGIKEDIIVKNAVEYKVLPFDLELKDINPEYITDGIKGKTFYDKNKKYLFNIEKPYAVDAAGVRSDNFDYKITKDSKTGKYYALLTLDSVWINDKSRKFPITIDPTIVRNTTALFAPGQFNHVKDTGSGSSPTLETYYQELPSDQYTLGLYHFNNGTCTTDNSGNSYTLTANGGMTCSTGGLLDYKASGFATTPVSYSNTTIMDNAITSGSIEAWINPSNLSAVQTILYADSTSDTLLTLGTSGQINLSTSGSTNLATINGIVNISTWTHVAATWTSAGHKIYINGIEVASDTNATTHTTQDYTTYVGVGAGGNTLPFSGSIDELRISSVTRTAEQIKADASRRTYSVYTSDLIDFTSPITIWNPFLWTELGVNTGDGETLKDSTSLISQWNLNDTSGTTATSDAGSCGSTCNGTLTSFASTGSQDAAAGTGWTSSNKRWGAGALMFDGTNDYVTCSDANCGGTSKLDIGSNAFTVSVWIKTSSTAGSYILAKGVSSGQYSYQLTVAGAATGGTAGLVYWQLINNANALYAGGNSTKYVADGNWHHVVGTWNPTGTATALYIDGKLEFSTTTTSGTLVSDSTAEFDIGRRADNVGYFNGAIDAVAIYSRALSPSEIMSNYQAGSVDFQTRVGATSNPNDGTWEAWKSTTNETTIETYDGPYQYNTTDSGIVGYWPMDETANDTCSGGQDVCDKVGTIHGTETSTQIVDGKFGKARNFTASTNQVQSASTSYGFTNISAEAWVYPTGTDSSWNWIVSQWQTAGANDVFNFSYNTTYKLHFNVQNCSVSLHNVTGNISLNLNAWNHVVGTYNSATGNITLYVNGVQDASTNGTAGTICTTSLPVTFGKSPLDTVESVKGKIDEVRLYNGVLSAATVREHYLAGSSNPNLLHPMIDSTSKIEGSASQKIETGKEVIDGTVTNLWHFDETGGTGAYIKDSTTNANNGTPTGTTVTQGVIGKGRSFNGTSDNIVVNDSAALDVGTTFSAEVWVKPNLTGATQIIYRKLTSGFEDKNMTVRSTGEAGFYLYNVFGGTALISVKVIADGKWHHVAGTYDGTTARLYIDGLLDSSKAASGDVGDSTGNLYIGSTDVSTTYFSGSMDELRFSSNARSAEEVAEDYRMGRDHYINKTIASTDLSGKTTLPFYVAADRPGTYLSATVGESPFVNYQPDTNTAGLWHLDEQTGSGGYIKDSSGNSNHGTPTGTTFTQGKIGKARSFNGSSDYVNIADNTNLRITNGTLSAWVKIGSIKNYNNIIDKYNFSTARSGYSLYVPVSGQPSLQIGSASAFNQVTGNSVLATGTWYYITTTFDGSNLKMYVNGVLDNTAAQSIALAYTADALQIGASTDFAGTYFNGQIDEARVDNVAHTATEIRQAYEVGLRTHPITIDFGAKLDAGNLITGSGDLGFTVDATQFGLQNKGDQLFNGDKIIVKENYDGTEYIAQGTVDSVTASTGAVTVSSWDSGSTFPSGGYTISASVFKWQREYWNIKNETLATSTDAITNLTLRLTNGDEGRTIWLDDLRSNSDYLTTPAGSTITSSIGNRYMQYRAVLSSFDEAVSATVSAVTIDYSANALPAIPSLDLPTDAATGQLLSPILKTTTTDNDSDYLRYKIQICTDSGMTTACQTFDETSSQTGWSGQNAQTSTAFNSGTQATYTIQTPLSAGTVYYWRSYAIDPAGTNTWSSTQATPYSFRTNYVPSIPSLDSPTNGATGQPYTTILKTTVTDTDSDYVRYKIQVCTNLAMSTSCQTFDQTSSQTGWSGQNAQSSTAYASATQGVYTLQTPLIYSTTYYWRSYAIDPAGTNTWSSTQATPYSFTIIADIPPLSPTTLLAEGEPDPINVTDLTPEFSAVCGESDSIDTLTKYRIQVSTDTSFSFLMWDSGSSGTSMTACNPGARSVDIPYAGSALSLNGYIYYWRIKFWDNSGTEGAWSGESPFFKMDNPNDGRPSSCTVTETPNDSSLTLKWDDNTTTETQFRIEKNTDSGGYSLLTNTAVNSTSNIDSSVSQSHTYQYRVRAEGPATTNWCETTIFSLVPGNFLMKGLNFKGLNFK